MALIDATIWNDYQANNATNEKRFDEKGVINLVNRSTPFCTFITPTIADKLRTFSNDTAIEIPVIQDQTVSVVTTPGFTFIPDNLTTSAKYSFDVYDAFTGFRHYPGLYANNMIDEQFDLNVKMTNCANALADKVEEILIGVMDARRTQVLDFTTQINQSSGGGTYTFDAGTDILTINKAAQQETMFSSLTAVMQANKLGGQYATVASPAGLAVQKLEALKFGAENSKNLQALGMLPADDMHNSHNIAQGSDNFLGYWVRKGAIGMFTNHPYNFRENTSVGTAKWSVSDVNLPFLNARANIYVDEFKANATGLVGVGSGNNSNLIMSAGMEMAIWFRFYVVYPYNSSLSTRANDIVKIKGLTS